MNRYVASFILGITLLSPFSASALSWNPFEWFSPNKNVEVRWDTSPNIPSVTGVSSTTVTNRTEYKESPELLAELTALRSQISLLRESNNSLKSAFNLCKTELSKVTGLEISIRESKLRELDNEIIPLLKKVISRYGGSISIQKEVAESIVPTSAINNILSRYRIVDPSFSIKDIPNSSDNWTQITSYTTLYNSLTDYINYRVF